MKVCYVCKENKSLDEFAKDKTTKDGLRRLCKSCAKVYNKKYREENKEKLQEKQKIRYERDKDRILDVCKKSREKHDVKIKIKARIKYTSDLRLVLYRSSRNRAKIKNMEHTISVDDCNS